MSKLLHAILLALALPFASVVLAAAPGGDASRDELRAWFGELRTIGVRVDTVLPWQYAFAAADGKSLEGLSVELVGAGYRIAGLEPAGAGGQHLYVVKTDLHTPFTLERRNEELRVLVRGYRSVRYLGASPTSP